MEDAPSLTLFFADPAKSTGAAVIVCPGGGYEWLAPHEGAPVAAWLNTLGITAAVLQYRIAPRYRHPSMLLDARRAVRTLRARAVEFGVDESRIGILGFSAGGHLASTAATQFDGGDPASSDPVERVSSRPDAAILIYPVITLLPPHAHEGSRMNLLGDSADPGLVHALSSENRVTPETPPVFLVHTADDSAVPVENSLLMARALQSSGVPVELHVFAWGPHGFGLADGDSVLGAWPSLCAAWLRSLRFA